MNKRAEIGEGTVYILVGALVIGVILTLMIGLPFYSVWNSKMSGQADLAHANYNRQIAVTEAEAKLHGAKFLADAEIERARGVAQANQIIGESLKNNNDYLKYLYINALSDKENVQTIYVPTENSMPLLLK